ncbi:MAG: hypothetical protein R3C97_03030 [Geminicoccaceae bacterium]
MPSRPRPSGTLVDKDLVRASSLIAAGAYPARPAGAVGWQLETPHFHEVETLVPATGSRPYAQALSVAFVHKDFKLEPSPPDIAGAYPARSPLVQSDDENGTIAHFYEAERLNSAASSLRSAREAIFSCSLKKDRGERGEWRSIRTQEESRQTIL